MGEKRACPPPLYIWPRSPTPNHESQQVCTAPSNGREGNDLSLGILFFFFFTHSVVSRTSPQQSGFEGFYIWVIRQPGNVRVFHCLYQLGEVNSAQPLSAVLTPTEASTPHIHCRMQRGGKNEIYTALRKGCNIRLFPPTRSTTVITINLSNSKVTNTTPAEFVSTHSVGNSFGITRR